jgi:hypothetical protein
MDTVICLGLHVDNIYVTVISTPSLQMNQFRSIQYYLGMETLGLVSVGGFDRSLACTQFPWNCVQITIQYFQDD